MTALRSVVVSAMVGGLFGLLGAVAWRFVEPPTFGYTYYATERYTQIIEEVPWDGDVPMDSSAPDAPVPMGELSPVGRQPSLSGVLVDYHPPWTANWPTATALFVVLGAIVFVGATLWKRRGQRLQRAQDEPRSPLTTFVAAAGLAVGLCVSIAILALPPGSTLDGVDNRFSGFALHFTDADTVWWLLPILGALVGCLVATTAAKFGWRLVRNAPAGQAD